MVIGVSGKAVKVTSAKPATSAVASKSILYWFGVLVVALYGKFADVVPEQTDGLLPRVIVGVLALCVMVMDSVSVHPLAPVTVTV